MSDCSVTAIQHDDFSGQTWKYSIGDDNTTNTDVGISSYYVDPTKVGDDCQIIAYYNKNHNGDKFLMKSGDRKKPPNFSKWNDHIQSIKLQNLKRDENGKVTHDLDRQIDHAEFGNYDHFCPGGRAEPKSKAPHIRCTYSDSNASGVRDLYNAKSGDQQLEDMYQVVIQKFCKGKVGDQASDPVCKEPYINAAQIEDWNKRFCEGENYNDNWCNCYNIVNDRCGELPDSTVCKNSELPQELADENAIGEDGYKILEQYKHCRRNVCSATNWRPANMPECPAKVNICGRDWNLGTASNSDIIRHCATKSGRSPEEIRELLEGFGQPGELGDWTMPEKKPTKMEEEAFAFGQIVVCCCLCIICMAVLLMARK